MTKDNADSLVGKQEDQYTEFKAIEALDKPATIAREVVAFLNADGGDIWVGVDEHNSVAVATRQVQKPEQARQALWNHLVDTIEPPPRHDEAAIEVVSRNGVGVIHVTVKKGQRKPYSLLVSRGRQFPTRIGDRIREMTLDEVSEAFRTTTPQKDRVAEKRAALQHLLGEARPSLFWWTLVPVDSLNIDFENRAPATTAFFRAILMDPAESNNRRTGWTMIFDESEPQFRAESVVHRFGRDPPHEVEIRRDGTMTFGAPRRRLSRNWDATDPEVFPFALIELPVSTFRLAARVFDRYPFAGGDSKVLVAAQVNDVAGARLRAGSPQGPFFGSGHADEGVFEGKDLLIEPFEVQARDIVTNPDGAAYRLVRRLYEGFGLDERAIPPEFDRTTQVLRFR